MVVSGALRARAAAVKGLLFDFYDTLASIEPAVIESGRRELARLAGVPYEVFAPLWRANSRERMLGTAGDLATQLREMLRSIGREPPREVIAEMAEREHRTWRLAVRLYPDVEPALGELRRRGFKLAILSNCSCQAGAVVYDLGLAALVDAVLLSYEVGLAKPNPAFYRRACAALGAPPPACAFVADGAGGELEAASDLGLLTIKIRRSDQRALENPSVRADARVSTLAEVLALLTSGPRPSGI